LVEPASTNPTATDRRCEKTRTRISPACAIIRGMIAGGMRRRRRRRSRTAFAQRRLDPHPPEMGGVRDRCNAIIAGDDPPLMVPTDIK
jgi:hypothetical protein